MRPRFTLLKESDRFPGPGAWVLVKDAELPRPVCIRVGADDDGRLICTGLVIDSEPDRELAARDLRDIKLAEILTSLNRPRMSPWLRERLGQPVGRARPGATGYPDDHYRQVAIAYRRAKRERPRAPIRALMAEFNVSEPTVHRWLRTAREKGFLKATEEES